MSEDTHWSPFLNASIHYIRRNYPQPWEEVRLFFKHFNLLSTDSLASTFCCLLHLHLLQLHSWGSTEKIHNVFELKCLLIQEDLKSCFHLYQTKKKKKKVTVSIYNLFIFNVFWCLWYNSQVQIFKCSWWVWVLALLPDPIECLPFENQAWFRIHAYEILDLVLICSCLWYMSYLEGEEEQIVRCENDFKGHIVFFPLLKNLPFSPCTGKSYRWSSICEHALLKM